MIFAKAALLPDGWAKNVRVEMHEGYISAVEIGAKRSPTDQTIDALICGVSNVHSHAFQRGFAGLTEKRGTQNDSFWTWREMMYRFALSVDPDDMEAIVQMAYVEMLEAGYTRVGEFHYLHHAPDGTKYDDPAEMTARIFAAATETGIALTHLPVLYAHGGFGPIAAGDGQRRFLHNLDAFHHIVDRADNLCRRSQDRVGIAPHSLRAVDTLMLAELANNYSGRPIHIHIAEQQREVADCVAFANHRPVEMLFETVSVESNWCLIHATHLTDAERKSIADSGAVVGLCPVTEANLGDGIFPASAYLRDGGKFAVGTDSNVRIRMTEELRLLEYGQRLSLRERNVLAPSGGSTARTLYDQVTLGGAQALGAIAPSIAVGAPADLVGLHDPLVEVLEGDQILDRWVFGQDVTIRDVWAMGHQVVISGKHIARKKIERKFQNVLRKITQL